MSPSEVKRGKARSKTMNEQNQRRDRNSTRRRHMSTSSSDTSSIDTSSSNSSSGDSQSSESSGSRSERVAPVVKKVRGKALKSKVDLTKTAKRQSAGTKKTAAKGLSSPTTKIGNNETAIREQRQRSEDAAAAAAAVERYNDLRERELQFKQEQQQKQKEQERREMKKVKLKKRKEQERQTSHQRQEHEQEQQNSRGMPLGPTNVTSPIAIAPHPVQHNQQHQHPPPPGTNTNPALAALAAALSQQQQHNRGISPQTQQQHVAAAAQLMGYETMCTATADGGLVAYLIPKVGTGTNNASRPPAGPAGAPNAPIQLSAQQRASLIAAITQAHNQQHQNTAQQRLIQQIQQQQLLQQILPGGILHNSAAATPLLARQNPQLILAAAAAANPGLAAALLGGNNFASLLGGGGGTNQNQNAASTAALFAGLAAAANQNQRRQSDQQQPPPQQQKQPTPPPSRNKTDETKDRSSLIDLTADDEDDGGRDSNRRDDQSTNSSTSTRRSTEQTKQNERKRKASPSSINKPGASEEQMGASPETRKRNKRKGIERQEDSFQNTLSNKQRANNANTEEDDFATAKNGIEDSEAGNDRQTSGNPNPYFKSGILGVDGDPFGVLHTQQLIAAAAIAAAKQRPVAEKQKSPTAHPVSRRAQASKKSPPTVSTDSKNTHQANLKDDTLPLHEGTEPKEDARGAETLENNRSNNGEDHEKAESNVAGESCTSNDEYFNRDCSNRNKVSWMSKLLLSQHKFPGSENKIAGSAIKLTPKELVQLSKTLQVLLEKQAAISKASALLPTVTKNKSKSDAAVAAGTTNKDGGSRDKGSHLMSLQELSAQNSRQIQMIREAERAQFQNSTKTLQRIIDKNQEVLEKQEKKIQELLREMRVSGQQHKESASLTKRNIDSIAQLQQRIQDEECLAANDSRIRNQQSSPNQTSTDSDPNKIKFLSKIDGKTAEYEEKVKIYRKQIKQLKDQIIEERNRVELSLRSYMRASVRSLDELRAE